MFQVVARHSELIFNLLKRPNSDLGEVEKAMFQVVARHCEIIFRPFTSSNCDVDIVEKSMILVVECHFEVILCFLKNRKANLSKSIKRRFKCLNGTLTLFFAS